MFSLFLFVSSIKMTSTSSLSCFTQDLFHLQLFNSNSDRFSKFSPWFQRQPNLVIWSFPRFHSHGQHHPYFILAFIKFYQTSDQVLFYRIARLKELVKLTRLFHRNPWIMIYPSRYNSLSENYSCNQLSKIWQCFSYGTNKSFMNFSCPKVT